MNSFELYNPVRVFFGEGQVSHIDEQIPKDARVLLTYGGGSIHRTGIYDAVRRALGARYVVDFGGIEPNPHYETLIKALPIIESEGITFILAVGGGSVIDGTKFIAAAAQYSGEDKWMLLQNPTLATAIEAMPFGTVLTLAATGSEMNNGAVITRAQTQEKFAFHNPTTFPKFSIVDPSYTLSLPIRQVANGVVDAFVHVVEQYLTYPVDARVQDRFAEGLLQTLVEIGPAVLKTPNDMGLRSNLSMAAMLALNGWIATGVPEDWSTHLIGHELTALFHLDHGLTLAIVLPHLLRDQLQYKQAKLIQCGERVFGITQGTEKERALQTIDAIERFFLTMYDGKLRLADYGIAREQVAEAWQRIGARRWKLGENRTIDAAAVERILTAAL